MIYNYKYYQPGSLNNFNKMSEEKKCSCEENCPCGCDECGCGCCDQAVTEAKDEESEEETLGEDENF